MKSSTFIALFILIVSISAYSQAESDSLTFKVVDVPAIPEGGYQGLYRYVAEKLKYPKKAKKQGVEGKVYVQFVITEDGSVDQESVEALTKEFIESSNGLSIFKPNEMADNDELNAEAVRVIKGIPDWTPAMLKGMPVKQRIILPITFKI